MTVGAGARTGGAMTAGGKLGNPTAGCGHPNGYGCWPAGWVGSKPGGGGPLSKPWKVL